ncbi:hypothetical protein H4R27_004755 [Coemansia aciculifera]|nr:hypothetical protein H4R27_004755 [Coemansia aciculifera]
MSTAPTTFLPTASPSDNIPTTGPAAADAAGPASNDHAATTLSVARRNISTVAGPAAHVPLPRLSITTLPVARATAAEKGKAWDLPSDGPKALPLYKRQRIDPRVVEVIDISSDEDGEVIDISSDEDSNRSSASIRLSALFDDSLFPGSVTSHATAHIRPTRQPTATPVTAVHAKTKKILPLLITADPPVGHHFLAQKRKRKSQALPKEVPESSQASERHKTNSQNSNAGVTNSLSHIIFDCSGEEVTSAGILLTIGTFPYVGFEFVLEVYLQTYDCQLMAKGDKPQFLIRALARLEGLEHWVPQHEDSDSASLASVNLLRRTDMELGATRLRLLEQLGLAQDPKAAVLGPQLCYIIVSLCSMHVDQMTGPVIGELFNLMTGRHLHLLQVTTQNGTKPMAENDICVMAKEWVERLPVCC